MSSNPKNNLFNIHMRKTKKRVTAATKLQALARGKHVRSQQKRQNNAVTKLQALARGKRDRTTDALPLSRSNRNKLKGDLPTSLIYLVSQSTTHRN